MDCLQHQTHIHSSNLIKNIILMRHIVGFISYINFDIKCPLHYSVLHSHGHNLVQLRAAMKLRLFLRTVNIAHLRQQCHNSKICDF